METCPIPMPDGSDCWAPPEPDGVAGICTEHMHLIANKWVGNVTLRHDRCPECKQLTMTRDRLTRIIVCQNCRKVLEIFSEPDALPRALEARDIKPETRALPRTDVVYYLRFGDRIKIGTTSNLPRRLSVLPHDEVLAIEPGNISKEKARHREFAASLILGQIEWFEVTPRLLGHAAGLRERFGPPRTAWRDWISRAA